MKSKPQLVYTKIIATNYEEDRQSNAGDIAFWEKEKQELNFAMEASKIKIASILEAGCGTGRFLTDLVKRGYMILGLDFSPYMLGMAKAKIETQQSNCGLVRADISHVPLSHFQPDFVYSIRVMNQLPSREYALEAIKELYRICKAPGAILFEYVNGWSLSRLSLKPSTYLSIRDIETICHREKNCRIVYVRGIVFFSQTLWARLPRLLLLTVVRLDSFLCRLLPMFSTRCYVLMKKERHETMA